MTVTSFTQCTGVVLQDKKTTSTIHMRIQVLKGKKRKETILRKKLYIISQQKIYSKLYAMYPPSSESSRLWKPSILNTIISHYLPCVLVFKYAISVLSRTSVATETEAALRLITRNHASTFWCVYSLYHSDNLIHFRSSVRVSIPASFHHICQWTWTTPWYIRS